MPHPSLELFEASVDGALGSLVCCDMGWLVALRVAGGLETRHPRGPFQPGPFCHSVILCSGTGCPEMRWTPCPFQVRLDQALGTLI